MAHGADPAVLGPYLAQALGDEAWTDLKVTLISGGKSNLTYRLDSAGGSGVLRRPPLGHVLPTAHDMAREHRVMAALAGSEVPVPTMWHFCDDPDVLGQPFYVMELVDGHIVRSEFPDGYAETEAERGQVCHRLVDTLGALHNVDPTAIGLAEFGRPDGYLRRQLARWTKQWEAARIDGLSGVDALGSALAASMPDTQRNAIVHGDYRLDNTVLDPSDAGRIVAVLDWEMSTLGDPLTDLGILLVYWKQADDVSPDGGLVVPSVTSLPGMLSRADVADRYATASGLDLDPMPWYVAFGYFKLAVVFAGIAMRNRAGAMVGAGFDGFDAAVPAMIEMGRAMLSDRRLV